MTVFVSIQSLIRGSGPIGLVSMLLFYFAWPPKDQLPNTEQRPLRSLDIVGSVLLIAAAVLVTFSFQNAGFDPTSWQKASFIAPLVLGLLFWVALFVWSAIVEKYWNDKLLAALPLGLLRNRVYTAGVLNTLFMGFPFMMMVYAFPLRAQAVNGKQPLEAGVLLLPMLGSVAVGTVLGGAFNAKKNFIPETLTVAGCLMVLGLALETTLSMGPDLEPKALGLLVFIGLGFGLSASTSTMMTVFEAPIREHAPAQGIVAQVRILGGSLGIAASSAILAVQNQILSPDVNVLDALWNVPYMMGSTSPHSDGSAMLTDTASSGTEAATDSKIPAVFAEAFNWDMRVAAIVVSFGIICAAAMWRKERLLVTEMRERQMVEETALRRTSRAPVLPPPAV
jgi:hypothetical protein